MLIEISLTEKAYEQAVLENVPKKYLNTVPVGAITDIGIYIQDSKAASYVSLQGPFKQRSQTRFESANARIVFQQISKTKVRVDIEPINRGSGVIGTYLTLPLEAVPALQIGLEMHSEKMSSSKKSSRKTSRKRSNHK